MSHSTVRSLLLAVLVVGAVGSVGPGTTYSLFTNTHDGTGTVSVADNINSGGNSGTVTADAGGPYTVIENGTVQLDASGSSTSKGNIRSYEWIVTEPGGSSRTLPAEEQVIYETPPDVSGDTDVELTVETNQGVSDTTTTTVTIRAADGCGATDLRFCQPSVSDRETAYAASYEVDDPNGEYRRVEVTLLEVQNSGKTTAVDTAKSNAMSGTLSVSDGNMNKDYAARLELYDTSGNRDDCRITETDAADGTDPNVTTC